MKTVNEIRNELKDVRYYYSKREDFDYASKTFAQSSVIQKAELYTNIIKNAPPKLYDLYVAYIVNNNSQEVVADDWGFCVEYIKKLCRKMYDFILAEINKEVKGA